MYVYIYIHIYIYIYIYINNVAVPSSVHAYSHIHAYIPRDEKPAVKMRIWNTVGQVSNENIIIT